MANSNDIFKAQVDLIQSQQNLASFTANVISAQQALKSLGMAMEKSAQGESVVKFQVVTDHDPKYNCCLCYQLFKEGEASLVCVGKNNVKIRYHKGCMQDFLDTIPSAVDDDLINATKKELQGLMK